MPEMTLTVTSRTPSPFSVTRPASRNVPAGSTNTRADADPAFVTRGDLGFALDEAAGDAAGADLDSPVFDGSTEPGW